jgi:hypothetical protein
MLITLQSPTEFKSAEHGQSTGFFGFGNLVVIDDILEAWVVLQEHALHPIALLSEILHHDSEYLL